MILMQSNPDVYTAINIRIGTMYKNYITYYQ